MKTKITIAPVEVETIDHMHLAMSLVNTVARALQERSHVGVDEACNYMTTLDHALKVLQPIRDGLQDEYEESL